MAVNDNRIADLYQTFMSGQMRQLSQQEQEVARQSAGITFGPSPLFEAIDEIHANRISKQDVVKQFGLIKKSLKQIEAESFDGNARRRIEDKINRLERAGATKQALILEAELTTKDSLIRLKEWDYKILPKTEINKFQKENTMTLTKDGLKLHIDPLEAYIGNPNIGEAKDRIIPDNVLEKLEEAKERQLFDGFAVLWAEKVKDPILLGCVDGCTDYFFVAEWSDDISFEQIMKGTQAQKKDD